MPALTFEPLSVPLRQDETGTIRVGNSQVPYDLVIHEFEDGSSPEAIVDAYDTLELADVYVALAYYLRHQDEVKTYLSQRQAEGDELRCKIEAQQPSREELRKKLEAREQAHAVPVK
jgi:uncharacterized protein (DUF433 family)